MITLAVDCMGGDHGPAITLPACRRLLERHADVHLLLVGLPEALKGFVHERATIVPASEVVAMDDPVEIALIVIMALAAYLTSGDDRTDLAEEEMTDAAGDDPK